MATNQVKLTETVTWIAAEAARVAVQAMVGASAEKNQRHRIQDPK